MILALTDTFARVQQFVEQIQPYFEMLTQEFVNSLDWLVPVSVPIFLIVGICTAGAIVRWLT